MENKREINLKLIREFVNNHLDKLSDDDLEQIDNTIEMIQLYSGVGLEDEDE
jgi:hypothetical protein